MTHAWSGTPGPYGVFFQNMSSFGEPTRDAITSVSSTTAEAEMGVRACCGHEAQSGLIETPVSGLDCSGQGAEGDTDSFIALGAALADGDGPISGTHQ